MYFWLLVYFLCPRAALVANKEQEKEYYPKLYVDRERIPKAKIEYTLEKKHQSQTVKHSINKNVSMNVVP
jgi:hypothetical protein